MLVAPPPSPDGYNIAFRPHPGPQTTFLRTGARDVFFGGAAGPGKSVCMIAGGLRLFHLPHYRGKMFRRTRKQAQELIIKASRIISRAFPKARWNGNEHAFINPGGGRLEIGYLRHDMDLENEEGQEYQYCVARGTPILMADGTYKPVEIVRVGDVVMTLQGPAPVTLTPPPLVKQCLSITVDGVTVVASSDHQVLSPFGWVALSALIPSQLQSADTTGEGSLTTPSSPRTQPEIPESGRTQPSGPALLERLTTYHRASGASTAGQGSGSAASGDARLEESRPAPWSALLVLHAPVLRSAAQGDALASHLHAQSHALAGSSSPGYRPGCRDERDCDGVPAHSDREGAQEGTPSRAGAESHSLSCPPLDGPARTPERSPWASHPRPFSYCHPYTMASQDSFEDVRLGQVWLAPAGEAEVYDLRVAGHSHYITSAGIVSRNCGFDELCQFPEHQAKFLHSRLRSAEGLPCLYRGTGNPRGIGLMWVKEHYVDPARPETLHWVKHKLPDGRVLKSSCMFVPGRLEDNPSLGDDYEISLALLGNPRLYAALRYGDWGALMGDAFPEWDPEQHVIDWTQFAQMHGLILRTRPNGPYTEEYCDIPAHWPIFMSYDWGAAKPFSVGWYTTDDWGRLYRIYEWYGCRRDHNGKAVADTGLQLTSREQAQGILAREERFGIAGRVEMRVADSAVWNDRGVDTDGPSIAEMFSEEGVDLDQRSDKRRIPGKAQIHARLDISEYEMDDGEIQESPAFMCLVTCKDFIRTVPSLPTCPKDPEDVDSKAEDHIYDEWRYQCMARPWHRKVIPPKARWLEAREKKRSGMVRR